MIFNRNPFFSRVSGVERKFRLLQWFPAREPWQMENRLGFVVATRGNVLGSLTMNILIENDETLEYLTDKGGWTKNPGGGMRFATREAALKAAKLEVIGRFNIVWHMALSNQLVNLDHGRGRKLPEGSAANPAAEVTATAT